MNFKIQLTKKTFSNKYKTVKCSKCDKNIFMNKKNIQDINLCKNCK